MKGNGTKNPNKNKCANAILKSPTDENIKNHALINKKEFCFNKLYNFPVMN